MISNYNMPLKRLIIQPTIPEETVDITTPLKGKRNTHGLGVIPDLEKDKPKEINWLILNKEKEITVD